ncbi:DEAD/DEAH box helicase [Nitrosomonas sp. Nm166]|uniref:DEAD/DEAH box helicase n=1 Tax=Nitrosomonas sp. Nm166 TaxID=1881054 RepID=UPI0008F1EFF3|nr:DEAD/DEAH box helicase [Nitrosomonas sp. Nm166]SFE22236.1 ATP-dependent RNA helicase RhlE [Nitrosomonas sp. Nm166]
MSFEQLGLSIDLLRAVSDQGYAKPTPIQEQAIPVILQGHDVMGGAQTGTGKTASFTLPMLRRLETYANNSMSPAKHPIRALILVPTRELAVQIYENVRIYGKYSFLKSAVIYGGVNIDAQIDTVRSGVEILVATPGRLLDHLQQKTITLTKVEMLILDEADRMLDMGFLPDIKQIIQQLPEHRQNLMFSATFSEEIKKLASKILRKPILIEVAKQNSVNELITHIVYQIESIRKQEFLVFLIKQKDLQQALVFTRTKQGADRLVQQLSRHEISSAAIHGDKNQLQRTQALNSFKQGLIRVLVATDVAARGLDIEELTYVINFELPNNPEDYVHRIGRTGRAGAKGFAISLVSKEENKLLLGVEKLLKTKIRTEEIKEFELKRASSQISDKDSAEKRKSKYNALTAQSKKTISSSIRQGEIRDSFNDEITCKKTKRIEKVEDPLFTQPYVPRISEVKAIEQDELSQKVAYHKKLRQPNRPLPALFISPVINKQK